jgi:hypothetical protein
MHDTTTRGIANKGFSGFRGFLPRLNFCNGGHDRMPQSLTGHTADRCVACADCEVLELFVKVCRLFCQHFE